MLPARQRRPSRQARQGSRLLPHMLLSQWPQRCAALADGQGAGGCRRRIKKSRGGDGPADEHPTRQARAGDRLLSAPRAGERANERMNERINTHCQIIESWWSSSSSSSSLSSSFSSRDAKLQTRQGHSGQHTLPPACPPTSPLSSSRSGRSSRSLSPHRSTGSCPPRRQEWTGGTRPRTP